MQQADRVDEVRSACTPDGDRGERRKTRVHVVRGGDQAMKSAKTPGLL